MICSKVSPVNKIFSSFTILQERLRKVQEEMERERRRKESEEKAVKEAEQVRHR